jgi:hypothetical protein
MAFDKKGLDDYVDVATRITEFRAKYPDGYLAPVNLREPYRIETIGDRTFIVVVAAAHRMPDDGAPGVGMAWEPFPGRTPYTRDSELMNAETSAWGRAIIALGAADSRKGIASREEVRNRQDEPSPFETEADAARGGDWRPPANPHTRKADRTRGPLPDDQWTGPPVPTNGPGDTSGTAQPNGDAYTGPESMPGSSIPDQHRNIAIRLSKRGLTTQPDRLGFCAEVIGRKVESTKELSYAEAAKVLEVAAA